MIAAYPSSSILKSLGCWGPTLASRLPALRRTIGNYTSFWCMCMCFANSW